MEYHLRPLGKTCAATGQRLAPGSQCHSVAVEQNGAYVRLDFSESGWEGPPAGTIGYWRCRVPESQGTAAVVDVEAMLRFFEQIAEDANPAQQKFCYILALILLQKRRLKLDGARDDGQEHYLQLSGSRGEGPYEIRDQQMSQDEMTRLQAELNQQLLSEWTLSGAADE